MIENRIVEYCQKISINDLKIPLKPYPVALNGKSVELTKSKTYFSGYRNWFMCPKCNSRVGTLYKPPNKDSYLCRDCHKLFYWDQIWKPSRFRE